MYCARWLFIGIAISIGSVVAQDQPAAGAPEKKEEPGPKPAPTAVPEATPVQTPMTATTLSTPTQEQAKQPAGAPSIPAATTTSPEASGPALENIPSATTSTPSPIAVPTKPEEKKATEQLPAPVAPKAPVQPVVPSTPPVAPQVPPQPAAPVAPPVIPAPAPIIIPPVQPKHEEKPVPQKETVIVPPSPVLSEDEITGIDTVDLEEPQGNWLFKRVWWERAESKYEKLRTNLNIILEFRMAFFVKRSDLDKSVLDPFYIAIGLTQGELQEVLKSLIDRLEQERKQEGVLDEKERQLLSQMQQELDALKQLQKDVDNVLKLDHDVDEALSKLMQYINQMQGYEQDAWKNFKEIARVLNDKKARELFYRIDTDWRNVSELQQYIIGAFGPHFDQLVDKIKQHVSSITSLIQTLKTKGIDFKKQAEMLKKGQKAPVCVREPVEQESEEEEQGFVQTYIVSPIKNVISMLWNGVVSIIRWPYEKIFGHSQQEEESQNEHAEIPEKAQSGMQETESP